MTETAKKRRGADATKTRAKIIQSARKLFTTKGFNGTSMREIATHAKVTQSLLHHHFTNKATLWQKVKEELTNQYFDDIENRITASKNRNKRRSLSSILENRFRFMQSNPDFVRMTLWQLLDEFKTPPPKKANDLLKNLITDFAEAQEAGEMRDDIDPAMVTVILFILTSGWFQRQYQWILNLNDFSHDNGEDPSEAYLSTIKKLLEKALAPDESSSA